MLTSPGPASGLKSRKFTARNGDGFTCFPLDVTLQEARRRRRRIPVKRQIAIRFRIRVRFTGFFHSGSIWSQTQIISASDGKASDGPSTSVAVRRGSVVIGAAGASVDGVDFAGAALYFPWLQWLTGRDRQADARAIRWKTGTLAGRPPCPEMPYSLAPTTRPAMSTPGKARSISMRITSISLQFSP